MLRHLGMNLFAKAPAKMSLKQKRFKAAFSDNFRQQVVSGF